MSIATILSQIEKGIQFVEGVPLLKDIPGIGSTIGVAVNAAGAVSEVVGNLVDLASQGAAVMSATDANTLQGYIQRMEAANKALDDWVDAHP